jgi:hypothetical protein
MTAAKVVTARRGGFRPHLDPGADAAGLARGYLNAAHGALLGERLRGLWAMLAAMLRKKNN